MRTLYLECNAGVSGDMLLGALADLFQDPGEARDLLMSSGIPDVSISMERDWKSHISGMKVHVLINGSEEGSDNHKINHLAHRNLSEVLSIIDGLSVSN